MMRIPLALLLALVLSGCLTGTDPAGQEETSAWSRDALPFGGDHDHADPAHHEGRTTPNFEVLSFLPLTSDHYGGQVAGGYLCGDAQEVEDGRRIAAVESRSDVGFALADVTDPAAPRVLGEFVMEHTYIYDLAVVLDGRHVVLATAGTTNLPGPVLASPMDADGAAGNEDADAAGSTDVAGAAHDAAKATADASGGAVGEAGQGDRGTLMWHPCDGSPVPVRPADAQRAAPEALPYPMNLLLVDISEPAEPVIVDVQPLAGNGHSIFPYRQDGRDLLVVASGSSVPGVGRTDGYGFWAVEDTPAGGRLVLQSRYDPAEGDVDALGTYRRHDSWVAPHPATGVPIAYLAGGPWLVTMDVSDPSAPERLGRWERPRDDGILHGAYPLPELWDGRHYTVVGPESCTRPEHTPTGVAWVLDTTDPASPHAVAAWTLPHDVEWDGCYMFSTHYFTVVGETLFMSLYHGGIWAIDLSPVREDPDVFHDLESIGVFLPADASLPPAAEPVRWAPTIEEVLAMPDGTLVTFDGNHGLYTLAFDAARPMAAPETWPVVRP